MYVRIFGGKMFEIESLRSVLGFWVQDLGLGALG